MKETTNQENTYVNDNMMQATVLGSMRGRCLAVRTQNTQVDIYWGEGGMQTQS